MCSKLCFLFFFVLKGALDLASAGVSISIFNIISKVFNIPLLSVATSFVAEDISRLGHSGMMKVGTILFKGKTGVMAVRDPSRIQMC